jgi:tetratricopeptide (TPR) repeat protein
LKKETVITAIVFFAVGFLAGYIYDAQKNWNTQRTVASAPRARDEAPSGAATAGAAGTGMGQALPEGHPPIDIASVVKTLEEQAAQNPQDVNVRVNLANYLYDHQRWQQAIEWYQKALALDPKNVSARTDLGTAYFNAGNPQEALREYRESLQYDPTHQPTLFNSIIVNLDGLHDTAAARQAWERLNKMNPGYPGLDKLKDRLEAEGVSLSGSAPRR